MKSNVVLLIDDDEDDRQIFKEALNEINPAFSCKYAFDGIDALNHLSKTVLLPDLIFLDLNMPKLSGMECLIRIKQNPLLAEIPVIIYSTAKTPELEIEAYAKGAVCFIQKPFDFKDILNCIRTVITEYIN